MMKKNVYRIAFLGILVAGMLGCASRNVAVVRDVDALTPPMGDSLSEVIGQSTVKPDDRLVLFRISYKNQLEFRQSIGIAQNPVSPVGRSSMSIEPKGASGDMLVLMRFKGDGGDRGYVQPFSCLSHSRVWCSMTKTPGERYLLIRLPSPGTVAYAGHLSYEIVDRYPDRGTQNSPRLRNVRLRYETASDGAQARKKWPFLGNRKISKATVRVKKGRGEVFLYGRKPAGKEGKQ